MDEFYEYWELIPEYEKYENVGKVSLKVFYVVLNFFFELFGSFITDKNDVHKLILMLLNIRRK